MSEVDRFYGGFGLAPLGASYYGQSSGVLSIFITIEDLASASALNDVGLIQHHSIDVDGFFSLSALDEGISVLQQHRLLVYDVTSLSELESPVVLVRSQRRAPKTFGRQQTVVTRAERRHPGMYIDR